MRLGTLSLLAVFGGAAIGLTLWAWGQPLICTCGYVKLFEASIWGRGNSQHIADWYTLSHILHGVLVILLGRIFGAWLGFTTLFWVALVTGVGWEIVEHTDWVLDRFRATNVNQGYHGDSVLNAVMDYVWMWVGFAAAYVLSTLWILVFVVMLEVIAAVVGRDSLTLTTMQLVYPLEAIDDYQNAIKPDGIPAKDAAG